MERRLEIIVCFEELLQPRENHSVTEGFFYLLKWFSRTHIHEAIQIISDMHNLCLVFLQYRFDVISFQRPALIKRQCNSSVFFHFYDDFFLQRRSAFPAVCLSQYANQNISSTILSVNRVPFCISNWAKNDILHQQIKIFLVVQLLMESCQCYQIRVIDKSLFKISRTLLLDQIYFRNSTLYCTLFSVEDSLNKLPLFFRSILCEQFVLLGNCFICLFESSTVLVVLEFCSKMFEIGGTKQAMNFWWFFSIKQVGWFHRRTSLFGFIDSAVEIIVTLACQFCKLYRIDCTYFIVIKLAPFNVTVDI